YQYIKWLFDFYLMNFQVLYSLLKSKLITCFEINDNQLDEDFNESC
ncbi:unnamed protein product, partial [Rotaria sp. Silwood2]